MADGMEEMEDFLAEALTGNARSPREAAMAVEEQERPPGEDAPIVVPDAPPEPSPVPSELPAPTEEPETQEEEEEEGRDEPPEDEALAWAKRKYGDDVSLEKVARAAYDQERHISQVAREKREADELAQSWYEYAQQVEAQAQQQTTAAMPLSSQEENWVEQAMMDPLGYARTAAMNGKTQLYQGVISRVAEENPNLAASIGTQVQMELQSYAQQQAQQAQPQQPSLEQALGESFSRLGLDVARLGPGMAEKIGELGEYHPYVRAIMEGDNTQRDLGVQAVADLVRATSFTPRQQQQQANIAQENAMRRDAASVQTGGLAPPAQPKPDSPLLQGMEEEWRRRGQWADDE